MTLSAIALSLLVTLGGIFLIAKAKKEELGTKFTFAGYAITLSGFTLTILSICFGAVMMFHHGYGGNYNKQCKYGSQSSCGSSSKCDGKSGATSNCNMSSCSKSDKSCTKSCTKSGKEGKCSKSVKKIMKMDDEKENVEIITE